MDKSRNMALVGIVLVFFSLLSPTASAQVPRTPLGGLKTGALISQAEGSAGRLVRKAGNEANEVLLRAAYAAELAAASLRVAYAESLDKTLGTLEKAERDAFARTYWLVADLEQAVGKNLTKVSQISQDISATVRVLPFTRLDPIVTRWEPLHFVNRSSTSPVRVSVRGLNLAAGEPHLMVRGTRLSPTLAKTDDLLVFELPGRFFSKSRFEPLPLDLFVYKKVRKWWGASDVEKRHYRISVFPIPPVIGKFTVHAKQEIQEVSEEARRTGEMRCHASHCDSDRESARVSVSEPHTSLKPGSARFRVTYENHGSHSMRDESARGFTVVLRCESYDYGPGCAWRGTRGQIKGYATYTVVKTTQGMKDLQIRSGELLWARDLRISIPPDILTVTVEMTTMLGEVEALTPGKRGRFFSVEFDRVARELILHPANPPDVLSTR